MSSGITQKIFLCSQKKLTNENLKKFSLDHVISPAESCVIVISHFNLKIVYLHLGIVHYTTTYCIAKSLEEPFTEIYRLVLVYSPH